MALANGVPVAYYEINATDLGLYKGQFVYKFSNGQYFVGVSSNRDNFFEIRFDRELDFETYGHLLTEITY